MNYNKANLKIYEIYFESNKETISTTYKIYKSI